MYQPDQFCQWPPSDQNHQQPWRRAIGSGVWSVVGFTKKDSRAHKVYRDLPVILGACLVNSSIRRCRRARILVRSSNGITRAASKVKVNVVVIFFISAVLMHLFIVVCSIIRPRCRVLLVVGWRFRYRYWGRRRLCGCVVIIVTEIQS